MLELPNWEHWGRIRDITLRDALVLSINLCPNSYGHENSNKVERLYAEKYWHHFQIAKSHIFGSTWVIGRVAKCSFDVDAAHTTIDFPKFCNWAVEDVQLADLPHEMRILGGEISAYIETANDLTAPEGIVAPPQKSEVACTAILDVIKQSGYDPLSLPSNLPGKKGVKGEIKIRLQNTPLFKHGTVFDNAWTKLLDTERIRYA
jgi:hypothetical protein